MTQIGVALRLAVAGLVLFLGASPAFSARPGASREIAENKTISVSTGRAVKTVRGGYVHALSLICDTAPCEVAVYDSDSSTGGDGDVIWEGRVADNNGTYSQTFVAPLVTNSGIAVEVSGDGATAFIAYE